MATTERPAGGSGRRDRWSVPVTTADAGALARWDQAVGELVALAGDPVASAQAALAADPGFAEARALCAYLELYAQTPEAAAAARRLLDAAPASAAPASATPASVAPDSLAPARAAAGGVAPARAAAADRAWPRGAGRGGLHLGAAQAWAAGELEQAALQLEAALVAEPHDLLALRVVQDLYFLLGDGRSLLQSAARVVRAWSEGEPGWGYVQGIYSFGLEESGDYGRAVRAARAALATDPADVWAVHSLAHVAEMQGRPDDGIAELLGSLPRWRSSYFAVHNWWHVGLFRITNGELDEALKVYDGAVRGSGSALWLDLVDAASLLWRLALYGVDVTGRATALVEVIEPLAGTGISAFNDWHAVMGFGLAGRRDLCAGVAAGLDRARGTNARVVAAAGRTVIDAFASFAAGDVAAAAEQLFAVRPAALALGGSHAQRDAIDLTLMAAAARAGDTRLLRALVDERLESRPGWAGPIDRLIAAGAA